MTAKSAIATTFFSRLSVTAGTRSPVLRNRITANDQASGEADGLPPLPRRSMYRTWAEVCAREFAALERAAERGRPTVLDPYGAEHPAEFFAVATEAFFERSGELRRRHPELFALLREYYCQDPAELEG